MSSSTSIAHIIPTALALSVAPLFAAPAELVFKNDSSIPVTAVQIVQDKIVIKTAVEGFTAGQSFPLQSADHIYGERPAEMNRGIALLLLDKPREAIAQLEPVVAAHRVSATIPGNFWIESARALLMAYALNGDSARSTQLGKEISDATPAPGTDPFALLGKALLMPTSAKFEERELALKDLTTGDFPAEVAAYASFFRGKLFKAEKKNSEALEALLSVPGLYPTGGLTLNAAAEILAADILGLLDRRPEATALVKSASLVANDTILSEEINKRLESLK
jgi:hypothetical protein